MKSMLLGSLAATIIGLGVVGASAQSTTDKTPTGALNTGSSATAPVTPAMSPGNDAMAPGKSDLGKSDLGKSDSTMTSQAGGFITRQAAGTLRAPKLVGVAVYDSNDKSVGKVEDVLLGHDGAAKVIVIGMGGFLGIGSREIGLPYAAIHWRTEARKVEAGQPGAGAADQPVMKTVPTAQTEAYQGYPDKAVLDMTQAELKSAPEFHYAKNPSTSARATSAAMPRKD